MKLQFCDFTFWVINETSIFHYFEKKIYFKWIVCKMKERVLISFNFTSIWCICQEKMVKNASTGVPRGFQSCTLLFSSLRQQDLCQSSFQICVNHLFKIIVTFNTKLFQKKFIIATNHIMGSNKSFF